LVSSLSYLSRRRSHTFDAFVSTFLRHASMHRLINGHTGNLKRAIFVFVRRSWYTHSTSPIIPYVQPQASHIDDRGSQTQWRQLREPFCMSMVSNSLLPLSLVFAPPLNSLPIPAARPVHMLVCGVKAHDAHIYALPLQISPMPFFTNVTHTCTLPFHQHDSPIASFALITTARGARGLRNVEILGLKQDPYMRLRAGGQVFKTRVVIDGGSMASWNERFQIPIPNVSERCV